MTDSILKTISNVIIYYGWTAVPGTNIVYALFYSDRTKLYYFDATSPSPITASSYDLTGMFLGQDVCYANYNSVPTIFVLSYQGGIYQVSLDGSGYPSSYINLLNSDLVNLKTTVTYISNSLYVSTEEPNYYSYNLITNTYTPLNCSGLSSGMLILNTLYYSNALYFTCSIYSTGQQNNIYKGIISGSSITFSIYLSGYINAGYLAPVLGDDTVYLTDYVSGGTSSILYRITSFTTAPSQSIIPISPLSSVNGMYPIVLSSDYSKAYIGNGDSTYTDQLLLVSLIQIPCLTGDCEILTPSGYIRMDQLKKDQLITTPDCRNIPILGIFSSEVIVTQENAPYRIPVDFIDRDVPNQDITLSPHHAYMKNGEWTLPVWTKDLHQEIEMIGQSLTYYHIRLENYFLDKLVCSNLIVDSWDGGDILY